jgi:putative restriction endonuclease
MLWLEMSRDEVHGGGEWGFTHSLWAPSYKRGGGTWPFWDLLLRVRAGDPVLHLRGIGAKAAFVGFSVALTDGFRTSERPPEPGDWTYASHFFRVLLQDYTAFSAPIRLHDVFRDRNAELRSYFAANRSKGKSKERLFFVEQAKRLQCLNGAYFSELSSVLVELIVGPVISSTRSAVAGPALQVETSQAYRLLNTRIGQREFSEHVRINYNSQCCFPGCTVTDPDFLIAGHIARWADDTDRRGDVSNGICFCLMHDKAFERGYFTISISCCVLVHPERVHSCFWAEEHVRPYHGMQIKQSPIRPSVAALEAHWTRIGFPNLHISG